MEIVIVGGGLTGSMFVRSLIAAAHSASRVPEIVRIVDHDTIEHRNAPGDLIPFKNAGVKKAHYLSSVMNDAGLRAEAVAHKVTPGSAGHILGTPALVVGCLDNLDGRYAIWEYCAGASIPYMDIGIGERGFQVGWLLSTNGINYTQSSPMNGKKKMPKADKMPPCHVIGSRTMAAIATELAIKSWLIFAAGIDPSLVVESLTGNKVRQGDIVAWDGTSLGNEYEARAIYLGNSEDYHE